jgi:hypothetical protein
MNTGEGMHGEHPGSQDVAAYLDGSLTAAARAEMQDHLADCHECRAEVSEVAELLHGGTHRKRWTIAAPAVAAAAAAMFLFAGPLARQATEPPGSVVRAPGAAADREAVPTVQILSPASDAEVSRDGLTFSWEPVGADALYRLTLTDEVGDPVWSFETSETSVEPTAGLTLEPGALYFWYLDALLPGGQSHTTDVRGLRILP